MGWDYAFELRSPTILLLILQVMYERGVPRWNDMGRGNSWFVHQSSLAVLPAAILQQTENGWSEWWMWPCEVYLFILANSFLTCRKILRHGASGFTPPPRWKACTGFLSPLQTHRLGLVWTHEPWVLQHKGVYTWVQTGVCRLPSRKCKY
jgi:hypothetical protein